MLTLKVVSEGGGSMLREPRVSRFSVVLVSRTGEDGGRKDGMLVRAGDGVKDLRGGEKYLLRTKYLLSVNECGVTSVRSGRRDGATARKERPFAFTYLKPESHPIQRLANRCRTQIPPFGRAVRQATRAFYSFRAFL